MTIEEDELFDKHYYEYDELVVGREDDPIPARDAFRKTAHALIAAVSVETVIEGQIAAMLRANPQSHMTQSEDIRLERLRLALWVLKNGTPPPSEEALERMRLTPAEYKALTYACQHGTFKGQYRKTLGALRDRLKSKAP